MNFLTWAFFGIIIGVISYILEPKHKTGGVLGVLSLGVIGAILGGVLGNLVFGVGLIGFNFPSLSIASLFALFLLVVWRAQKNSL